jgi:RimJ/RimL family protein N-acetyltransferase
MGYEIVGSVGLHAPEWDVRAFEVSYWIVPEHVRKGFCREAVGALITMARNALFARRLVIKCDSANLPSQAVARAIGFELEGVLKASQMAADGSGEIRGTMVFATIC